jgi:Tol biopolymer transport system component/DNA-binding winged helix-turn-helix (wHTH) protein
MVWYEFDSFRFETDTLTLSKAGEPVALAPKPAVLLLVLLESPERYLSKDELKSRGWPDQKLVSDNALFFQLSCLRDALDPRTGGGGYINSVPNRGYRFMGQVERHCTAEADMVAVETESLSTVQDGEAGAAESAQAVPPHRVSRPNYRWAAYMAAGLVLILSLTGLANWLPTPRIFVSRYQPLTRDGLEKEGGHIFSDGARVYFEVLGPHGMELASVSVRGGELGPVPIPAGFDNFFDLDPGSSEVTAGRLIAGQTGRELWSVPLFGGSPRRLGDLWANDVKWSPNGQRIAFTLGGSLSVASFDGTGSRKIVQMRGTVQWPRWSPNGNRLRFTVIHDDVGEPSIWESDSDGKNLHPLLHGRNQPSNQCCGVWTPDGEFYVFQSVHDGRSDLWGLSERSGVLRQNSQTPILLTSGLQGYYRPTPGVEGKQIFALGKETRGELVRFDLKLKAFVPSLGGIAATWVNYSKTNQSVVYIRYPDLTVWRSNLDGSDKAQITFNPFEADGLASSPDENWLLVRGRTPGTPWRVYRISAGGGKAEALVPSQGEQAIATWSPDGKSIAFGDVPAAYGRKSGTEAIHVLRLSDHSLSDLPGSRGLWTARWSPDGRHLAALTIEGQRLMLYDFAIKTWLPTDAINVNNPTWTQDSEFIYYDAAGSARSLLRVRVADGHIDKLFNLDGYPTLSWWWSGVTPDKSPLILRNLGSTEIYALTLDSR